ncbi:MAG: heat-inducible transcriptional repressor HrcA [Candidatus Muiribacteriota bacterium]
MISERKKIILKSIVDEFINTGEPVASRILSKKNELNFSSATIRNEMAELAEIGLIERSHSYSGGIPSDIGYRFYVDNLLDVIELNDIETNSIERITSISPFFQKKDVFIREILNYSLSVINRLSDQATFIFEPGDRIIPVKNIKLVKISECVHVIIYQLNNNIIENKLFFSEYALNNSMVEKINNFINYHIKEYGSNFVSELKKTLLTNNGMFNLKKEIISITELVQSESKLSNIDNRALISGMKNLLKKPEFENIEKVRKILDIFENTEVLQKEIKNLIEFRNLHIKIGAEFDNSIFNDFSIIGISYCFNAENKGFIGVLGPKRMEYRRIISIVKNTSMKLSELISEVNLAKI